MKGAIRKPRTPGVMWSGSENAFVDEAGPSGVKAESLEHSQHPAGETLVALAVAGSCPRQGVDVRVSTSQSRQN
jgi:hypothetical protein